MDEGQRERRSTAERAARAVCAVRGGGAHLRKVRPSPLEEVAAAPRGHRRARKSSAEDTRRRRGRGSGVKNKGADDRAGCVAAACVCGLGMVNAEGVSQASAPTLSEMLRTASVADDGSAIRAWLTNCVGGSAAAPMRRGEERGERPNCRRLLGTECAAALWTELWRLARAALEGFVASIVKPTRRAQKQAKSRCVSTLVRSPQAVPRVRTNTQLECSTLNFAPSDRGRVPFLWVWLYAHHLYYHSGH